MIRNEFHRVIFGLGVFWIGLHLVGLAIWQNGYVDPGNVIWRWFQSIWSFEFTLLKIILGGSALYILTSTIFNIYSFDETEKSKTAPNNEALPKQPAITIHHQNPAPSSPIATSTPGTVPTPPPPSADELKRRALKQITGKEHLKR